MHIVKENWFVGGVFTSPSTGKVLTYGSTMVGTYTAPSSPRRILDMYIREMVEEYIKGENMNTAHEVFIR